MISTRHIDIYKVEINGALPLIRIDDNGLSVPNIAPPKRAGGDAMAILNLSYQGLPLVIRLEGSVATAPRRPDDAFVAKYGASGLSFGFQPEFEELPNLRDLQELLLDPDYSKLLGGDVDKVYVLRNLFGGGSSVLNIKLKTQYNSDVFDFNSDILPCNKDTITDLLSVNRRVTLIVQPGFYFAPAKDEMTSPTYGLFLKLKKLVFSPNGPGTRKPPPPGLTAVMDNVDSPLASDSVTVIREPAAEWTPNSIKEPAPGYGLPFPQPHADDAPPKMVRGGRGSALRFAPSAILARTPPGLI